MRDFGLFSTSLFLIVSGIACNRSGTDSTDVAPAASTDSATTLEAGDARAAEILRETQATYAAAGTYRDTGTETLYQVSDPNEAPKTLSEIRFETRIKAPDTFRVDVQNPSTGNHSDIFWNGGESEGRAKRFAGSIQQTYESPADYTLPTNHEFSQITPKLMLPFLLIGFSKPITDMKAPAFEGEEVVEGHPCWVITGEHAGSNKTLWIDQQSHLIRKVRRRTQIGPRPGSSPAADNAAIRTTEIITLITPELNPSLTDEDLRYLPPAN